MAFGNFLWCFAQRPYSLLTSPHFQTSNINFHLNIWEAFLSRLIEMSKMPLNLTPHF
jgi:hypothetical protein